MPSGKDVFHTVHGLVEDGECPSMVFLRNLKRDEPKTYKHIMATLCLIGVTEYRVHIQSRVRPDGKRRDVFEIKAGKKSGTRLFCFYTPDNKAVILTEGEFNAKENSAKQGTLFDRCAEKKSRFEAVYNPSMLLTKGKRNEQ